MKNKDILDPIAAIRQRDLDQKKKKIIGSRWILVCISLSLVFFVFFCQKAKMQNKTILECEVYWEDKNVKKLIVIKGNEKIIFPLFVPHEKFIEIEMLVKIKTSSSILVKKRGGKILNFNLAGKRGRVFLENKKSGYSKKQIILPRKEAREKLYQLAQTITNDIDTAKNKTFASLFQELYKDTSSTEIKFVLYEVDYKTTIHIEIENASAK